MRNADSADMLFDVPFALEVRQPGLAVCACYRAVHEMIDARGFGSIGERDALAHLAVVTTFPKILDREHAVRTGECRTIRRWVVEVAVHDLCTHGSELFRRRLVRMTRERAHRISLPEQMARYGATLLAGRTRDEDGLVVFWHRLPRGSCFQNWQRPLHRHHVLGIIRLSGECVNRQKGESVAYPTTMEY